MLQPGAWDKSWGELCGLLFPDECWYRCFSLSVPLPRPKLVRVFSKWSEIMMPYTGGFCQENGDVSLLRTPQQASLALRSVGML